jgi:hypothetical protein
VAADTRPPAGPRPEVQTPRGPESGVRRRSEIEIRWRQFRNAPRPVVRAVTSSLIVATVLGIAYLVYDVAISRGADLPGGDLRTLFVTVFVIAVLVAGALVTYVVVPLPTGSGSRAVRTPWSAALGLLAAAPIAYLVLVLESQVVKPLLV